MQHKVSVILLSFNQVKYIQEAIDSVFKQTYHNWELIISDNGSTDGTDEIIKFYKQHPKIKLSLNSSNEYITKRYNQALELCDG